MHKREVQKWNAGWKKISGVVTVRTLVREKVFAVNVLNIIAANVSFPPVFLQKKQSELTIVPLNSLPNL